MTQTLSHDIAMSLQDVLEKEKKDIDYLNSPEGQKEKQLKELEEKMMQTLDQDAWTTEFKISQDIEKPYDFNKDKNFIQDLNKISKHTYSSNDFNEEYENMVRCVVETSKENAKENGLGFTPSYERDEIVRDCLKR